MDDAPTVSNKDGKGERPSSEQLSELHVYLVPEQRWLKKRKLAKNHVTEYAVSAGFIRVVPQYRLVDVRREIERQLGHDVLPPSYVFLKSVGRNFTQVKASQERDLKAKNFMPPHANEPEIYLKAGSYTDQYWSQGDESGVEDHNTRDTRRTRDILDNRARPLSPVSSPDGFLPEVESTKLVLSRPSKVRRSSLSSAERRHSKPGGSFHHVTTTTTTRKSTTTVEEHSSTKLVQLVKHAPNGQAPLHGQTCVKSTPIQRTASEKDVEDVQVAPRLPRGPPEDLLETLRQPGDPEGHGARSESGRHRGSLLGVGSTGPGYIIVPDGRRDRSPSPGPSGGTVADAGPPPEDPTNVREPRASSSTRRRGSYAPDTPSLESRQGEGTRRTVSRTKRRGSYVGETSAGVKTADKDQDFVEEGRRRSSMAEDKDPGDVAATDTSSLQSHQEGDTRRTSSRTKRRGTYVGEASALKTADRDQNLLEEERRRSSTTADKSPSDGAAADKSGLQRHQGEDSRRISSKTKRRGSYVGEAHTGSKAADENLVDDGRRRSPTTEDRGRGAVSASEASSQLEAREDQADETAGPVRGSNVEETVSPTHLRASDGRAGYRRGSTVEAGLSQESPVLQELSHARSAAPLESAAENVAPAEVVGKNATMQEYLDVKDIAQESDARDSSVYEEKDASQEAADTSRVGRKSGSRKFSNEKSSPGRQGTESEEPEHKTSEGVQRELVSNFGEIGVGKKGESQGQEVTSEVEVRRDDGPGVPKDQDIEWRSRGPAVGREGDRKRRSTGEKAARRSKYTEQGGLPEGKLSIESSKQASVVIAKAKVRLVPGGPAGQEAMKDAREIRKYIRGEKTGKVIKTATKEVVDDLSRVTVKRATGDEGAVQEVVHAGLMPAAEKSGLAGDTTSPRFAVEVSVVELGQSATQTEEGFESGSKAGNCPSGDDDDQDEKDDEEEACRQNGAKRGLEGGDGDQRRRVLKGPPGPSGRSLRGSVVEGLETSVTVQETAAFFGSTSKEVETSWNGDVNDEEGHETVVFGAQPEGSRDVGECVDGNNVLKARSVDGMGESDRLEVKVDAVEDTRLVPQEDVVRVLSTVQPLSGSGKATNAGRVAKSCEVGEVHAHGQGCQTQPDDDSDDKKDETETETADVEAAEDIKVSHKEERGTVAFVELEDEGDDKKCDETGDESKECLGPESRCFSEEVKATATEVTDGADGVTQTKVKKEVATVPRSELLCAERMGDVKVVALVKEDDDVEGDRAEAGEGGDCAVDDSEVAVVPSDGTSRGHKNDGPQNSSTDSFDGKQGSRQDTDPIELPSLTDVSNTFLTNKESSSDQLRKEDSSKGDISVGSQEVAAEVEPGQSGRPEGDPLRRLPVPDTDAASEDEQQQYDHAYCRPKQYESPVTQQATQKEEQSDDKEHQTRDDVRQPEESLGESSKEDDVFTPPSGTATRERDLDPAEVHVYSQDAEDLTEGPFSSVKMELEDADACNEVSDVKKNQTAKKSDLDWKEEVSTEMLDEDTPSSQVGAGVGESAVKTDDPALRAHSGHDDGPLRECPSLSDKLHEATRTTELYRLEGHKKLAGSKQCHSERCQEGSGLHARSPEEIDVHDGAYERAGGVDANMKGDVVTSVQKSDVVREHATIAETKALMDSERSRGSKGGTTSGVDDSKRQENSASDAVVASSVSGKSERSEEAKSLEQSGQSEIGPVSIGEDAVQDAVNTSQDCVDHEQADFRSSNITAQELSTERVLEGTNEDGFRNEIARSVADEKRETRLERALTPQHLTDIASEGVGAEKQDETGTAPANHLSDTVFESSDSQRRAEGLARAHQDTQVHGDDSSSVNSAQGRNYNVEVSGIVHENTESANAKEFSGVEQNVPAKPPDTTVPTQVLDSAQDLAYATTFEDSDTLSRSMSQASDHAEGHGALASRTEQLLGTASSTQDVEGADASRGEDDSAYVDLPLSVSRSLEHSLLDASRGTRGCDLPGDGKRLVDEVELPDEGISVDGSATRDFSDDEELTRVSTEVDTAPSSSGRGSESSGTPLLPPVHQPIIKTPTVPRASRVRGPSGTHSLPQRFRKETRLYETVHRRRVSKDTSAGTSSVRRVRSDEGNLDRKLDGTTPKLPAAGRTERESRLARNCRSVNMEEHGLLEFERLKKNLEALRSERQVCEAKREDLLRRVRFLQHKTSSTRDQARDLWRRRYLDEKKATPRLEEECGRWRLELEKLHRELLAKLDGDLRFSGHRLEQPSDRLSYKIMIAKILQEIEDLKRRLEYTRVALGAEVRLRSHAEREVKALREDLVKKKIQVTLTRKETQIVMAPFLRDCFYFVG